MARTFATLRYTMRTRAPERITTVSPSFASIRCPSGSGSFGERRGGCAAAGAALDAATRSPETNRIRSARRMVRALLERHRRRHDHRHGLAVQQRRLVTPLLRSVDRRLIEQRDAAQDLRVFHRP